MKRKDPYSGWTHEDFQKEFEELAADINSSIDSINEDYYKGRRPDMAGPLDYIDPEDD